MQRKKKRGFTLVELAIVIAVIAVLAAILVPTLTKVLSKAKNTVFNKNVQTVNGELIIRSMEEDRSGYTVEEVKKILSELNFNLNETPEGYSLWYDAETNNVRALKNKEAFTSANRAKSSASGISTYATPAVDIGYRPVEALNPYNRNLYYIDETNAEVNALLADLNGNIVVQAEENASNNTTKKIAKQIVDDYTAKINALTSALKVSSTAQTDLVSSFDFNNTLFIGKNGMYIYNFDSKSYTTSSPSVTCTNAIIDSSVTEIRSQKLSKNAVKTASNVTIATTIILPNRIEFVESNAFASLGDNASNKITVEICPGTVVFDSGTTGASVSVTQYSTILDENSLKYNNANIVYGTDYNCTFTGNYFYMDDGGLKSGTFTNGQTLANVADGARVKYLVPDFRILNNENGFFGKVSKIDRLYLTNNKTGNLVKYNAIVLLVEDGVTKGYKFSNVGYITNLNTYVKENYEPISHTGKSEAFPTSGKSAVTVKLPDGTSSLDNLKGQLSVKINYKPVINHYDQKQLMDGTLYYELSKTTELSSASTDKIAVGENGVATFVVERPSEMAGGYTTYGAVVQSVEVYFGNTLILVRNY